jgi:hypothetical protein
MQTKFRIVETEDYILAVSDEETTGFENNIWVFKNGRFWLWNNTMALQSNCKPNKVIAYKPKGNTPELDLPLLPEMVINKDITEDRIYCVDIQNYEFDDNPINWSDEKFISEAEIQGNIYSLKGFVTAYNKSEINQDNLIIRLVKAKIVVEDDVEKLPYDKLCYYDTRSSDFQIKEEYGYDKEEVDATGEFPKKDCACDNCFYGRAKLADRIIKSATRKYSEYDLRKAFEAGMYFIGEDKGSYEEFIQSFKQPKPKWFVAEMESRVKPNGINELMKEEFYQKFPEELPNCVFEDVLKTTTTDGKEYLVGTYIND